MLFITWNVDPVFFSIGPLSIRYYGLLWALTFVLGYIVFQRFVKKENLPDGFLDSLVTYMFIGTLIGARVGHCFFYEPSYYLSHPFEIIKIWKGGLSSHGGAIGILVALYLLAKKWHMPMIYIVDRVVICVALGGACIRTGNLMNSEIYGNVTELPWGMVFVRAGEIMPKHPTQIYEALVCIALWASLMYYYFKQNGKLRTGFVFGIFLIVLFTSRFLIEFVKEPQVEFENNMILNMGQLLSIPFIIAGVYYLVRAVKKPQIFKYVEPKGPKMGKDVKKKRGIV